MAHAYIETNEGKNETNVSGENEIDANENSELTQWLISNNILNAKQKLMEKNVTLEELAEICPDNAKVYAEKTLELDVIETNRFVKAVCKLNASKPTITTPNISTKSDTTLSNSNIIVLSKETNNAINSIYDKKEEINKMVTDTSKNINSFKDFSETNKDAINEFRKEIINKINERIDELLLKSNTEIDQKINILSEHLNSMEQYTEKLNVSESEINKLIYEKPINTNNIRQTKILESKIVKLSKDVLSREIIEPNIKSEVNIQINKNDIFEYINSIGNENVFDEKSENDFEIPDSNRVESEEKENLPQLCLSDFGIKLTNIENVTDECWKLLGHETESSDNSKTITKLSNDYSSHFGNVSVKSIKSNVYIWKIKINKVKKYFAIGISSNYDCEKKKAFYCDKQFSNYAYCDSGKKISQNVWTSYGKSWSDGDVVGIKLDEIQKRIEFFLNDESQGIAYKNIYTSNNVTYKLAVHMYYKDSSVTIQSFECVN